MRFREEIERGLRAATSHARELAALGDATFTRRPSGDGWSAAECLAHLNLTTEAFLPRLRAAMDAAPPGVAPGGRPRRDPVGWLLETMMGVAWMRTRTKPAFVPLPPPPAARVLAEFERLQEELIRCLARAESLPLGSLRIESPFADGVRYNLYSCFRILLAHQVRHLRQADAAAGVRAG